MKLKKENFFLLKNELKDDLDYAVGIHSASLLNELSDSTFKIYSILLLSEIGLYNVATFESYIHKSHSQFLKAIEELINAGLIFIEEFTNHSIVINNYVNDTDNKPEKSKLFSLWVATKSIPPEVVREISLKNNAELSEMLSK